MLQSGQKLVKPAIKGITPKKNQLMPVTTPIAINVNPIAMRNGLQNDLILLKFIFIPCYINYMLKLYQKIVTNQHNYQLSLKYMQTLSFLIVIKTNMLKSL